MSLFKLLAVIAGGIGIYILISAIIDDGGLDSMTEKRFKELVEKYDNKGYLECNARGLVYITFTMESFDTATIYCHTKNPIVIKTFEVDI